jgi:hypothetical protein
MKTKKQTVHVYINAGDFVRCNNCDEIMLLPTGADKCPACYFEGALGWENEKLKEIDFLKIQDLGEYDLIIENGLNLSEYLSNEILTRELEICPDFRFQNRENNRWEIIDDERVIFFGEEEETKSIFKKIFYGEYCEGWKGNLKLIEVHCVWKHEAK